MERQYFASCQAGFEELIKAELANLGITEVHIAQGGVYFYADLAHLYTALLTSRLISRIMLPLAKVKVYDEQDLYHGALAINWQDIFDLRATFMVDFRGTNGAIRNSQFGAMRVKDAIVDYCEQHGFARPMVDKNAPDVRIMVYLHKNQAMICFDFSGEPLHARGYRKDTGQAPLRETLAASLILRSQWCVGEVLIDPLCGSGTILIEAAMLARNIPPQIHRVHWGFEHFLGHDRRVWEQVKDEVKRNILPRKKTPSFFGYDCDPLVIARARENAQAAGVGSDIRFAVRDIKDLHNPCTEHKGALISNPPYGERLGSTASLVALYSLLGEQLKRHFAGWKVSLLSSEDELLSCLRLRAVRQFRVKNGPLDCVFKNYLLAERENIASKPQQLIATDFANRLVKNIKKITAWADKEGIDSYRLYDADLPEYNVAIDKYADYVVVQEYKAPKNIDPKKARSRLLDIISATLHVMQIPSDKLVLKTREKQRGHNQYQKLSSKGEYFEVDEYGIKFWVNVNDYLDTGLFLDHRLTRKMIGDKARGKRFLNLFAYTGAASVHAALGGAMRTTTVDLSNTYLNWAENNFDLNDLNLNEHRFIQADCLHYLAHCSERFDLIFIDPPTFSNSKRMQHSFDIERDQMILFTHLKRILAPQGEIIFSNNKRHFKIDVAGLSSLGLQAVDITHKTIPFDFARNGQIHNCWIITEV